MTLLDIQREQLQGQVTRSFHVDTLQEFQWGVVWGLMTHVVDPDCSVWIQHEKYVSEMIPLNRQPLFPASYLNGESWISANLLLMKQLFGVQSRSKTCNKSIRIQFVNWETTHLMAHWQILFARIKMLKVECRVQPHFVDVNVHL